MGFKVKFTRYDILLIVVKKYFEWSFMSSSGRDFFRNKSFIFVTKDVPEEFKWFNIENVGEV